MKICEPNFCPDTVRSAWCQNECNTMQRHGLISIAMMQLTCWPKICVEYPLISNIHRLNASHAVTMNIYQRHCRKTTLFTHIFVVRQCFFFRDSVFFGARALCLLASKFGARLHFVFSSVAYITCNCKIGPHHVEFFFRAFL